MDDLIRIGRISALNYKEGTAKVVYKDRDDMVTGDFPLLATEYMMPKVDDMVLVLHFKNCKARGVIIGPIWNDNNRPEINGKGKYLKRMTDKASFKAEDGTLEINAEDIKLTCSAGTITVAQLIRHIL